MATKVHTFKNSTFQEWKDMVMAEFSKRSMLPLELHPKRHLHGYEAGDTVTETVVMAAALIPGATTGSVA